MPPSFAPPLFTAAVEALGPLLSRLRRERGITQADLAAAVGIDQETIAKVEQGRARRWRPRTARGVFQALERAAPLQAEDRAAYAKATGMVLPSIPTAAPPADSRAAAELELRRIHRLVDMMIQAVGTKPVIAALTAAASALRVEERLAAGEDHLTVVHPPVQRGDYVEQVEVDYIAKPAAPTSSARARKASR